MSEVVRITAMGASIGMLVCWAFMTLGWIKGNGWNILVLVLLYVAAGTAGGFIWSQVAMPSQSDALLAARKAPAA